MTKNQKVIQTIMEYELKHSDYEWWLTHQYVLEACRAGDFSVLSGSTPEQVNNIHRIYDVWVHSCELAKVLEEKVHYSRIRRGY